MPKGLRSDIARLLSLFLALYILSFSIGVPDYGTAMVKFGCIGSENTDNLLEMVLEVEIDGHQFNQGASGRNKKEAESESCFDSLEFFSPSRQDLSLLNYFYFSSIDTHGLLRNFNSRAQEINSPPPKS